MPNWDDPGEAFLRVFTPKTVAPSRNSGLNVHGSFHSELIIWLVKPMVRWDDILELLGLRCIFFRIRENKKKNGVVENFGMSWATLQ